MRISSHLTNQSGDRLETEYIDVESFDEYNPYSMHAAQCYCFYDGKLVVVYAESKGYWGPPGGGIEEGESVEEATIREVREETNMRVLAQKPIGLFKIYEKDGNITHQARTVCIVEPIGPFVPHPDEEVTEIRCIDPSEVTDYFDWGETGAHQLTRALEIFEDIKKT
jgi:8-oxo-dGTP diphosphatase